MKISTERKTNEFTDFPHSDLSATALLSDDNHLPDPSDAADRPSVLKGTAGYIIVTEFCERLAYFGFAGSLVLFFQTQLNMSNADAGTILLYSVFKLCFLSCIFL
jgi:hypothetical protein